MSDMLDFLNNHPISNTLLFFFLINFISDNILTSQDSKKNFYNHQNYVILLTVLTPHIMIVHELFHYVAGSLVGRKGGSIVLFDWKSVCPFYCIFDSKTIPTKLQYLITSNAPVLIIIIVYFFNIPLLPRFLFSDQFINIYTQFAFGMMFTSSFSDFKSSLMGIKRISNLKK